MSVEMQPEPAPEVDLTGRTIAGRYNVLRRLGEGGMGVVYSAMDTRLEKQVAIKVLKEDFAHRQDVVARFTQEAKSAARIKHENVLDVTDYGGTEDGSFYIAMELLVGTDLADVLHKEGAIELHRALNVAIQVTRALQAAHKQGIVHRDLKPENVFLVIADDGREVVKIVDFGIAQMKDMTGQGGKKLTQTGMIFGTPEYMSPEQAKGVAIDHRVDIYAVGVILYEMAAGRTPFVGDSFMGILTQHLYEPAPAILALNPNAQITPEYESVIAKALAKDPAQRYQSMQELCDDLVRVRDGARPTAITAVISNPSRPNGSVGLIPSTATGAYPAAQTMEMPREGGSKPAGRGSLLLGVGLVAALALAGGAVALNAMSQSNAQQRSTDRGINNGNNPQNNANNNANNANNTVGAQNNAADAGATVAAADAGVAAPMVRLHFVSTPPGAQVFFQGSDDPVCATTPCDVNVRQGESRVGYATARNKRGEFTVTATSDGQQVEVALTVPRRNNTRPTAPNTNTGTGGAAQRNGRRNPRCRPGEAVYYDQRDQLFRPCES
ncbi:MAG: serine/threonine protein kinase [Myxococcales bacterium]|nr:serine/threonine protein kinase [Myxococcales bacterium]